MFALWSLVAVRSTVSSIPTLKVALGIQKPTVLRVLPSN